jgi:hypothetical protein
MQQSNIETFASYSQFKSLKDFNNNLESFLSVHKKELTPNEVYCFKALSRFAVRCLGVSNISINKLLKAISEKFKKVSESTFHRFKRKAIKLGILSVYSLSRSNGSQSSNLWVFNRFIATDTPREGTREVNSPVNQQSENDEMTSPIKLTKSKTNNHKTIHTEFVSSSNNQFESTLQSKYIPSWINEEFFKAAKPYFELDRIEEMWRISVIHSRINKLQSNHLILASIQSLKVVVRKMKKTVISNPMGFYNGVSLRIQKGIKVRSMFEACWDN